MPKDEFDPEDPMELVGVELPASDMDQTLEDLIQEFLMMGYKPAHIFFLFRSPFYGATHQIYLAKGHDYVKERVFAVAGQWNVGWLSTAGATSPTGGTLNG